MDALDLAALDSPVAVALDSPMAVACAILVLAAVLPTILQPRGVEWPPKKRRRGSTFGRLHREVRWGSSHHGVDISTYHLRNERRLGSDAEGRQFRRQFRVKREIAYKLINDLHRQLCMRPKRTRSDSVSPSEAVLMYLSYCSEKGGSANKVEALFGRGVSTVHKWVDEVAVAISNQYYDTEIRKPTKQEATEIMEWFV